MQDNLLVSTDWLQQQLGAPDLRVVDIRGRVIPAGEPPPHYFNHRDDWLRSHIPGAVFVDWVREITDPDDPRHAPVAPPARYQAFARRIGISADTRVVAYDDADGMFAARLWWTLLYYGHRQVAVLDGGWQRWLAEGRPVTDAQPAVTPGDFVARPDERLRRTRAQLLAGLESAERVLVDVRSPAEYAGQASRARRRGHIPGALNLPRTALVDAEGGLLPAADLRALFAQQGLDEDAAEIVTYCNAGVSASYGMLALRAAGFRDVAVYDGSWKDWGNDDTTPVAS